MLNNKKGVSIMIGYILLISIAVAISAGVYVWLKSYVPQEKIECPDGISISVGEIKCNLTKNRLDITLQNNGRFSYIGYLLYGSNNSNPDFPATIDFTPFLIRNSGQQMNPGIQPGGIINPGDKIDSSFSIIQFPGGINALELTPIREDSEGNRKKLLICSNAKIRERVSCS